MEATSWEEPNFNSNFHPALGKKFCIERTWYARYVKAAWKPSATTGTVEDVCGVDKWGDLGDGPNVRKKPKLQASVPKPSECNKCGQSFPSRSKLFKHLREAHDS